MTLPARRAACALLFAALLSPTLFGGETLPEPAQPHSPDLAALRAKAQALRPALTRAVDAMLDPDDRTPQARKAKALEATATAFMAADQAYLRAWYEALAALDAKAQRRHIDAQALVKHCEEAESSGDVGELPIARLWYAYMRGKAHGLAGQTQKARETWAEALDDPSLDDLPKAAREALRSLKEAIAHDYIKLLMRASEEQPARYADAARTLEGFTLDEELSAFMKKPPGCALRLDYARALVRQPDAAKGDYFTAMDLAFQVFEQGGGWAVEASKTMAEIAGLSRDKKVYLDLPAAQWYAAARGFLIHGLKADERAKSLREDVPLRKADGARQERAAAAIDTEAHEAFEDAIFFYQLAVLKCREGDRGHPSSPLPPLTPAGDLNAARE